MVYIIWMVGQYPIEPLSGSEHSSNAGLLLHHGENAGPIHAEGDGLRRAVISDSHGRRTIVAEITSSLRAAAIDCPAPGKAAHRRRRAEGGRRGRQLTPGRGIQRGCGRRQPQRRVAVEQLARRGRRRAAPAPAADGARAAARGPVADVHDVGLLLVHVSDGHVTSARLAAAFVAPQPRLPGRKAQHEAAAREFATRRARRAGGRSSVPSSHALRPRKELSAEKPDRGFARAPRLKNRSVRALPIAHHRAARSETARQHPRPAPAVF